MKKFQFMTVQDFNSPKPLLISISFNEIDGFIRVCGSEFRHLVLFDN